MKSFILPLFFFVSSAAQAQSANAWVNSGVAYIMHTVKEGEDAARAAAYYGLTLEQITEANPKTAPVAVPGNTLRVPIAGVLSKTCKTQDCIKVMYKVGASEGLYRIGINFGNQSISDLKELNKLKSEQVSAGQELVVGYINPVKQEGSVGQKAPEKQAQKPETKIVAEPVAKTDAKTEPVVVAAVPAPQVQAQTPAKQPEVGSASQKPADYKGKGFFQAQYQPLEKLNTLGGTATGFKSMSGWQDGKFYALINDVPVGTIIKVSQTASTDSMIYAKVLGPMPELKKDAKLLIVISEAGMAALGATVEQQVSVQVNW